MDADLWFDVSALDRAPREAEAGSRLRAAVEAAARRRRRTPSSDERPALAAFAALNGLDHRAAADPTQSTYSSRVLVTNREDVVSAAGPPYVEFGNNGWRYAVDRDGKPPRRGYIAIRHGLALPEVLVESRNNGPANAWRFVQAVWELVPNDTGDGPSRSGLDRFKDESHQLDLGEDRGRRFGVYCSPAASHLTERLFSESALAVMDEVAASFDVEIGDEWLLMHSCYGDVVTHDADVWAWVFSVTSRVLDLLVAWGSECGVAMPDVTRLPLHTVRSVGRPARLDDRPASVRQ